MKKNIFCVMTSLIVLLVAGSVFAGVSWTAYEKIIKVTSHDGYILITMTNEQNLESPCTGVKEDYLWFYWPTSDGDSKDMLTLALAALLHGHNVKVHYSTEGGDCLSGIPFAKMTKLTICNSTLGTCN